MLAEDEEEPVAEVEHPEPSRRGAPDRGGAGCREHEEPSRSPLAPAEEAAALYDQSSDELDLDLPELDDEPAPAEAPSDEHPAVEPEGTTPLEPPIESLDTVEHPFHEEIVDDEEPHDEAAPSDEYAVEEPPAPDARGRARPGACGRGTLRSTPRGTRRSGEDVLADTPEFLKDAPEDDELWFEQGEPKDFDF